MTDDKTPEEACKAFLQEMGTSVHLMQQGFDTTILTTLNRAELVAYLNNVCAELIKGFGVSGNAENTDIVHIESETTPDGSTRIAAILKVEVSPQ
jgi:hypothetical protein